MNYLKPHLLRWTFPTVACLAYLPLLMHKSEFPAILNRYSLSYTILLLLAALNVALLWYRAARRISHRHPMTESTVWSLVLFLISAAFVIDFASGLLEAAARAAASQWVSFALLAGISWQVTTLGRQPSLILGRLAAVSASFLVGIVLIELVFVAFLIDSRNPRNERDFLRVMSLDGQWPQPVSRPKPPGTFRILGLADSFGVVGWPTNYHYVLQDILGRKPFGAIQVVNISVGAYAPRDELAILPFGIAYSPDLVLHGFFVGNDFTLDGEDLREYLRIPVRVPRGISRYRPFGFSVRWWIDGAIKVILEQRRRQADAESGVLAGSFSKTRFLNLELVRMNAWARRGDDHLEKLKQVLPILDAIRSAVDKAGARYVMVIHPEQAQVDENLRREIIQTFRLDERDYDFDLAQTVLKSHCIETGKLCLDLLADFRAAVARGPLYELHDSHYNARGNRLAAEVISRFLQSNSVLPASGILHAP
jgi:hypothetical protein